MIVAAVEVEIDVAHSERATLRVGDVFLKVDADQTRIDLEVAAETAVLRSLADVVRRREQRMTSRDR